MPAPLGRARRTVLMAACVGLGLAAAGVHADTAPAAPSPTPARDWQQAFSRPSQERNVKFAAPGLVAEVLVEEGDRVTKGQPIAQQDDRQERATLDSLKVEADSTAEVDYSKTDKADKEVKLKRKQELHKDHLASDSEVEEAALAVQLAEAQIKVSQVKHDKAVAEARRQQIKVEQMKLYSPADGVVIVNNDPLWVEMDVPTAAAAKLKVGQPLEVGYWQAGPNGTGTVAEWQPATIKYFDPKASASGGTERVRLVLPNPQQNRSGLEMRVKLPADAAAAAAVASNN